MFVRWVFWLAAIPLVLPLSANSRSPHYSKIRIEASSEVDLRRIASLGLPLDEGRKRRGPAIDLFVNQDELRLLEDQGIPFQMVMSDWRSAYAAMKAQDAATAQSTSGVSAPFNFHLGSMGGYLTLKEIGVELAAMRTRYPTLVGRIDTIGRSVNGRPLWGIKISWNPLVAEDEPRVLYTALHHAREPISVMQMMYYMWYLLETYGTDPEVTAILNSRELYFVPVVNPDGYAENERTDPQGGGMWRKNMRDNGDGSMGVDLNRNFGFKWGADNSGSSGVGNAETFRGKSAFSEPETQAIRDLCKSKRFALALNCHSYGNLLVVPWGYEDKETPDSNVFRQFGEGATRSNYYAVGRGGELLYNTNGDSDDWMYGDTLTKPKIIALTPEVGSDEDAFWPAPSRIVPLSHGTLGMNLYAARTAGALLDVEAPEIRHRPGSDTSEVVLQFTSKGLRTPLPGIALEIAGINANIAGPYSFSTTWALKSPLIVYAVRPNGVASGSRAQVQVTLTYDGGRSIDTIEFRHGDPRVIFFDDADTTCHAWTSSTNKSALRWDTTSTQWWSPRRSYTDSPMGSYSADVSTTFTLNDPIALDGGAAELRFHALWDIEAEYDMAVIEASSDEGATWAAVPGRYTRPASEARGGKQIAGLCGYDRTIHSWVEEVVDLQRFIGKSIHLRWRFESDAYEQRDGIYFDDVKVLLYPKTITSGVAETSPASCRLEQNYPNPFNPSSDIRYLISEFRHVKLAVYDLLGKEVATLVNERKGPGAYQVRFDAAGLASGVYVYRLTAGTFTAVKKLAIVK
jgi:carboxypeptidase T